MHCIENINLKMSDNVLKNEKNMIFSFYADTYLEQVTRFIHC